MRTRGTAKPAFLAALAWALVAIFSAQPAMAVEEVEDTAKHAFNARLSLTGGCLAYPLDEIPDPDCPYPLPPAGPTKPFTLPRGVAVDDHGDVYVASAEVEGTDGRVDVFDPQGEFITEMPEPKGPRSLAVDSKGNLYVYSPHVASGVLNRYEPTVYDPAAGEIAYDPTPHIVAEDGATLAALAVNPGNNHLFVNFGSPSGSLGALVEYGSGEEENPLVDSEVAPVFHSPDGQGLAIDTFRGRLYATDDSPAGGGAQVVRVFELASPHHLIKTINGSTTPEGSFLNPRYLMIAADEGTGNLFVYAQGVGNEIWELTEDGGYVATIKHGFKSGEPNGIAVDNGSLSPNGALNGDGRYLWATTARTTNEGHAFAFGPRSETPPAVEEVSFESVGEAEAELLGKVNPGELETTYAFEYVTRAQFEASGFAGAQVAGEGTIAAGALAVPISAEATGLSPGTRYLFRLVATNELGSDKAQSAFATYPASPLGPCGNGGLRTGPSALLPDCRAYELVTPPDTNARAPMGSGFLSVGARFAALLAAPAGNAVSFRIEGGLLPGSHGSGSLAGDPYRATRGPSGWTTVGIGGSGEEASIVLPGGRSPEQGYSVWQASGVGPAAIPNDATYLHYPDGHSELLGQGSLGVDPLAKPKLITANAGHVIFASSVHLEEKAPPTGKQAIYDRSLGGPTRVVSLLPGNVTTSGDSNYVGASLDGRGIAFTVGSKLYLRVDNEATYEIGEGSTFEGIALGGHRLFYLNSAGSLIAFDAGGGIVTFADGNPTVVNVAADGTSAYFVSTSKLSSGANPLGELPKAGKQNLYLSREGAISFVGAVTEKDVEGEGESGGGGLLFNGLGLWGSAVRQQGDSAPGAFAIDPSRTTPDGSTLLFQSRARLTEYDSGGAIEVYRYDSVADTLVCISCNPTEAPAAGEATLQSIPQNFESPEPATSYDPVQNLSTDGWRAVFQSDEALVPRDTDNRQDVYEWEAQGTGSCTAPSGCLYLLGSGHSGKDDYLYAADEDGSNVFIWTSDLLTGADADATPSIYDARIGGGFAEGSSVACQGEGCRPQLSPPPALPAPGSVPASPSGNVSPSCPKGKRRVRRHGKAVCIQKKQRKHRHHKHHHARTTGKGPGK